jgi:hypothetical protein
VRIGRFAQREHRRGVRSGHVGRGVFIAQARIPAPDQHELAEQENESEGNAAG